MRKSKIIKIALPIIILTLAALTFLHSEYYKKLIQKQSKNGLTLYGNIDIRQVELGFRVSGKLKKMNYEEGDVIKSGDLLATLDDIPYQDELRVAKAQLAKTNANLTKLKNGNRSEETAQAKALVEQYKANYNQAKREMIRQKALYADKVISRRSNDLAITEFEKAKALLASANEALQLSTEGFREEDIKAGHAEVQLAKASLMQVETKLNDTKLLSPSDGIILTRLAEPGKILTAGQSAYTLCLNTPVWVRAYIDEPDLGKIHLGMKALIYTDSYPDKAYTGKVGFISPEAEFTPKTVQTPTLRTALVYRLRIIADNPDNGLRQGIPVTVKLINEK